MHNNSLVYFAAKFLVFLLEFLDLTLKLLVLLLLSHCSFLVGRDQVHHLKNQFLLVIKLLLQVEFFLAVFLHLGLELGILVTLLLFLSLEFTGLECLELFDHFDPLLVDLAQVLLLILHGLSIHHIPDIAS